MKDKKFSYRTGIPIFDDIVLDLYICPLLLDFW